MKQANLNDRYYNRPFLWGPDTLNDIEQQRIEKTISLIPNQVDSILDVGCGDGRLTNSLMYNYNVVGLEKSYEAIKFVRSRKIIGSLPFIPFRDNQFDLVICTEVLEHLPYNIYENTLQELERIASKYILISVPNEESVENEFIKCQYCGCVFNIFRHLRDFNLSKMRKLFDNFEICDFIFWGPFRKDYNKLLLRMRHFFNGGWSNHPAALCPQCGNDKVYFSNKNLTTIFCGALNRLIPKRKKRRWIIALYKRVRFIK